MNIRRFYLRIFFVLTAFAGTSLLAMLNRPSLANIRAVDVVHLIGTGMCIGAAILSLVVYFRDRHSS